MQVVIMGPEVIVIKFYNHLSFSYALSIYGYDKARRDFYENLINKLDLKDMAQKNTWEEAAIPYKNHTSPIERAYINFRIAY